MSETPRPPLLIITIVAAAMAAVGALATVIFIRVLDEVIKVVWTTIPDRLAVDSTALTYAVPVCAFGGLLLGVARHYLGEQPKSLEAAMVDFKETRQFDYRHLPQGIVISLISLGAGAALGPEAALVALVGGVCSWVGNTIKASERATESMTYVGIVGALGAVFGTIGVAAIPIDPASAIEKDDGATPTDRRARLALMLPGLVSAFVGLWLFKNLSGTSGYFNFGLPEYTFSPTDLGYAVGLAIAGFLVAVLLLLAIRAFSAATGPIHRLRPLESMIGGVVLGLLAGVSHYALFSGHEGIDDLLQETGKGATFFAGILLLKIVATSVCAATGWKGGRFFPIMFMGSAAGLACAAAMPSVLPVVGLAAVMTASVAALLQKPIPAIALMLFFFPSNLWGVVVVAGLVAGALAKRLGPRLPIVFGPDPVAIANAAAHGPA